ncbi:MAG: hypothetical protein A2Y12_20625 [Planctomycetes bacterium GWF2_42_9]|nr:MAG: hypothetical protein A2Y12_20625 [Planctomycetes bacterium GWF2_42_9]
MFFRLQAIADHPCCNMQDVVEAFFRNSIDQPHFSVNLFPEWFHSTLEDRRCTLNVAFRRVHELLYADGMNEGCRRQIYVQFESTNRIQELCDGTLPVPINVIVWESDLGKSIDTIMSRLYESLDLVIFRRGDEIVNPTKELYSEFIKLNKYVCPFCGLGRYKNVHGSRREDFDHYLHKSDYPLAAANMRNLVPSCGICNQDYKGFKDVLADGTAFYPYADIPEVSIHVTCVHFPSPANFNDKGQWSVEVALAIPDATAEPKLQAWDRVYEIKKRLKDEVREFCEEWMNEVTHKCTGLIDPGKYVELISSAREEASDAAVRRMEPGQLIRRAFYDFALNNVTRPFFESFRVSKNATIN